MRKNISHDLRLWLVATERRSIRFCSFQKTNKIGVNDVRNGKGQIVYRTNTHMGITKVYDGHNVLLGWCQNGQTRNAQGTLIALSEAPSLLVPEG